MSASANGCGALIETLGEAKTGRLRNKNVALLALTGFAFAVAGCNTIEGIGKDVKATGGAIEKAADKAKPK